MENLNEKIEILNNDILKYAFDNKICSFEYILKSVKNGYRKHFRDNIVGGTWYNAGEHPNKNKPKRVNDAYRRYINSNGWLVSSDRYYFEQMYGTQNISKGLHLYIYISYDEKVYLAWNSDGFFPKIKKMIKDKELKNRILEINPKLER